MTYYQKDDGTIVSDPSDVKDLYNKDRGIGGIPWTAIILAGGVFWLFVNWGKK